MQINVDIEGKIVAEQIALGEKVIINTQRLDLGVNKIITMMDAVADGIITQEQADTLMSAFDILSIQFEKNKKNIFVNYNPATREVDLTQSHVRVINGVETRDPIPTGFPIKVSFVKEIGIFESPQVKRITKEIKYGESLDQEFIDSLALLGITLTGDGSKFVVGVDQKAVKIIFEMPENEETVYVKNEYSDNGVIVYA